MKKISLIIPVYNTANELRRCLDSASNQTYQEMEIICVDDGSTDGSQLIVDEYKEKDSRFVILHKKNGGESSARNMGLQYATGDYIAFMDCDDWIEPDMYEEMMQMMEASNADLVAASWYKSFDKEEIPMKNHKDIESCVFGREKLLRYIYERDAYQGFAYMWNKLYRRDILLDETNRLIQFDEDLKLGGDVVYLAKAALNCKRAAYIPKNFYHYYQRNVSGCHTDHLDKRMDWLQAYFIVIDLFEKNHVAEETIQYVKRFLAYHSSNVAEIAWEQRNQEVLSECQRIMDKYKSEYISLNCEHEDRIERYEEILEREMID